MSNESGPERERWTGTEMAVAVIGVVLVVVLSFPVYALGNRVEPILVGMPFSLLWVVFWLLAAALALLVVYLREQRNKGAR